MATSEKKLHLGCGRRFHPAWDNIDFCPRVEGVILHDLREPLPYPKDSITYCHTAHVLGNFPTEQATALLQEQLRVLKSGGIARFVVPDLQQVIQEYRELIGPLCEGDLSRAADYEWNQIELYDQVARSSYGGKMAKFLTQEPLPNRDYILSRIGEEGAELMDNPHDGTIVQTKISPSHLRFYFHKIQLKLIRGLVQFLGGKETAEAFREGCFRRFSGEIQWQVYDQYSLTQELKEVGFVDIKKCHHDESRIPSFKDFCFDTDEQGVERKPESLYLEASKP